jgi:hypothetical protein
MSARPEGRPAHSPAEACQPSEPPGPDGDSRLAEAVEEYRAALRAGRRPDRQALCARYPDLGAALAKCLDAVEFVHLAARDLGRKDSCASPKESCSHLPSES